MSKINHFAASETKMAKKGKGQKVAPKEQSDADADQAAGEAGGKKGKKVKVHLLQAYILVIQILFREVKAKQKKI